jgi:hypothetical protein
MKYLLSLKKIIDLKKDFEKQCLGLKNGFWKNKKERII